MSLAAFQQDFWHTLWADAPTGPWAAQPGFAVYRNTVRRGCVEALLSLYPAVRRLVGDDWLGAVALDHVLAHPPDEGRLQHYGECFAAFLATCLPDGDLPWLPAVARLDRLWSECHVAADAPVLTAARLAATPADALGRLRLTVHPATRWCIDSTWPVFSLWRAARDAVDDPAPPHWHGESALFTRPDGEVLACDAGSAAGTLLDACAAGRTLPDALADTAARHPATDPGALLALLLSQGAFTENAP
ncbi:MAG: DNA-binding domain-containing protein [Rhizobacter sp.]